MAASAPAQDRIPAQLEGWRDWVLHGEAFRRCPFLGNSSGATAEERICAWPGRLALTVGEEGARFSESWVSHTPGWIPLPGDDEHWPREVRLNGAPAAVVNRSGVPSVRVGDGTLALAGRFEWSRRPETLKVPDAIGLVSLTVNAHAVELIERTDGAVWLGPQHSVDVAQHLTVQVYRRLSDGIPVTLQTRLELEVAGVVREETLPAVLPRGFVPMALDGPLPARLDPDGQLHVQVRAGTYTVTISARAESEARPTAEAMTLTVPARPAPWPRQEIWSYAADPRLRVAALEGADPIDPTQANVPAEWREDPSYRVLAGEAVRLVERARGASALEANHLRLARTLYLDFSHAGFTVIDDIAGTMRTGWRLDMQAPYRLMHASSSTGSLLITEAPEARTGVEVRDPNLALRTVARIETPHGAMAASGWEERFDEVQGTLHLPPGHRLLAAWGADRAPQAWLERWRLIDVFLLLLSSVVALRLLGWPYALIAFAAIALTHQEEHALTWLILLALMAVALVRAVPMGRARSALQLVKLGLLGVLLVLAVPFAFAQLRLALYPQLGVALEASSDALTAQFLKKTGPSDLRAASAPQPPSRQFYDQTAPMPVMPRIQALARQAAAKDGLSEAMVTGTRGSRAAVASVLGDAAIARGGAAGARTDASSVRAGASSERAEGIVRGSASSERDDASSVLGEERYAPGTLLQAGPGVPQWQYLSYEFGWSGPVESTQTVHFWIVRPLMLSVWRVLGVALLTLLVVRLARGSGAGTPGMPLRASSSRGASPPHDASSPRRAWWPRGAGVALLVAATALASTPGRAQNMPSPELLEELRSRLTEPAPCAPDCADAMYAEVSTTPTRLEVELEMAALARVAVPLPVVGSFEPDLISVDGKPVPGVLGDEQGRRWIPLEPGAHHVRIAWPLPGADAVEVLFPWIPRAIHAGGSGWEFSGVHEGTLLGNTLALARRRGGGTERGGRTERGGGSERSAGRERGGAQASTPFAPFVRVSRALHLGLDWTVETSVERLAPEQGGFTVPLALLPGERVLTPGVATVGDSQVIATFDSQAREFHFSSALPQSEALALTAPRDAPESEVWLFTVSPIWHVEFAGLPAVLPDNPHPDRWALEYDPRPGETLTLHVTRPPAAAGDTLALDHVALLEEIGRRSRETSLHLDYRSTQGGRHVLALPAGARVTGVSVDGRRIPIRMEKSELPLALVPGAHAVDIVWESEQGGHLVTRTPAIDLHAPGSNVDVGVRLPESRWVLLVGGAGVGPVILYWGELALFVAFALLIGRVEGTPLGMRDWLILGLGLSTFSWGVLLLFAVWIFALRWREAARVDLLEAGRFQLLQVLLMALSIAALVALLAAIPYGLFANPDMRIAGTVSFDGTLHWFNDREATLLPRPWVLSLSLGWYKAAMLLWALWLAFALSRWLPRAWRALGTGGYWRPRAGSPGESGVPPPAETPLPPDAPSSAPGPLPA